LRRPDPLRQLHHGRGATENLPGRFETRPVEPFDDGWGGLDLPIEALTTTVREEAAKSILTKNDSPDIPFDVSLNAYRGCEHGCVYCFARTSHAFLDMSPGLDFETKLVAKTNAAERLEQTLRKPRYEVRPIAIGTNTDSYQPIEKRYEVTRQVLQVLDRFRHPVTIVTKSAMILRDLDLLISLAKDRLVHVYIAAPLRRIETLKALHQAGVPVGVLAAPMIPALNDHELEPIAEAAKECGAYNLGYILLRLPHEVAPLFERWLETYYPTKAKHVLSVMRQLRGGKLYRSEWGERMRGSGPFADLLRVRFERVTRKLGLDRRRPPLNVEAFSPPAKRGDQLSLFQ
jgi:DNA repair photolyase